MADLELVNVSKYLGKNFAIRDLSLRVESGEVLALLGPSGCGKTTTLRLIAGLEKPDAGSIMVDGNRVSSASAVVPPERRQMGMVPQDYGVWPHMSVYENVAFGLKARHVARSETRSRVANALKQVRLEGFEERLPNALSGGQLQRVALARGIVTEPSILLLDEPLSNLDARIRDQMRDELRELQERTGITFVYVTHDQSEALALATTLAVLKDGVLVQADAPSNVYERPSSTFVGEFMGDMNWVSMRVVSEYCAEWQGQVRVSLQNDARAVPGDWVSVGIRPHMFGLWDDGWNEDETVPARIVSSTYLGRECVYVIDVDGVRVRVCTDGNVVRKVGDVVRVGVVEAAYPNFQKCDLPR